MVWGTRQSTEEMTAAPSITVATEHVEPVHAHKWLVAAAVMLGAFLGVLDTSIVNVALPYMQGSFAASVDEITWIVTSYLVATGVTIPLTGWIAARIGRKRYFILSVTLFVLGSTLCGSPPDCIRWCYSASCKGRRARR